MGAEEEVQKKIEQYSELAASNKNIDAAALMISALEQARQDEIAQKKKKRAYLISVGVPPLGLFFALRYFFSDSPDGKRVARNCVILTVLSLLLAWWIGSLAFSGSGSSVNDDKLKQLQAINAQDVKGLLQ